MDEDPSLLVVVFDASQGAWAAKDALAAQGSTVGTFQGTLEAMMVFLQSYLLMHRRNDIAVVACGEAGSRMVFPTPAIEKDNVSLATGGVSSKRVQSCIVDGLRELMSASACGTASVQPAVPSKAPIAKALSQALCFTHRKITENPSVQTRLLVVQAGPDAPESYNAVMNCIFSAQKAQIPVDCLCVGPDSVFMQQAADVTGGVYCHVQEPNVLQQLLTLILPSQACRKYLRSKGQETVDFRAACFCHRRLIEIAYVCSVCLSVFCEFSPICATCGTRAVPKLLTT
eukprot:TRINITY_DN6666_c0_g1_i1.p1 TRINITY_DN6666_c0_g1~~TRINITY_DN6666_c0_g1_i1.p1  ORF type:complete len:310 (+),score=26.77 TRINITY_DN6666_c0_g1_i1:73-930(+)